MSQFKGLQPNSLRNGTGNFCSHNREFFRDNREFNRASSEIAELLSDVELARLLMSTPHFCDSKIGGLPAFGGRAGAADIAGDAPEISRGTAPKFLLAAPAQPSNRAARGRAL